MSIYTKLLEVQKEIGAIKKDSTNPFFKSKYFDINSLLAEVKPVLNKHGLVLLQPLSEINGKLALKTVLMEDDDYRQVIEFVCPIPEGIDAQKTGSAITYFRRYALTSLLALEAEDDDGEGTKPTVKVGKKKINPDKPPFGEGADENEPTNPNFQI